MQDQRNENQPLESADTHQSVAVSFSQGIRSIPYIERFLGVSAVRAPATATRNNACVSCVLTWGRKNKNRNIRAEIFRADLQGTTMVPGRRLDQKL